MTWSRALASSLRVRGDEGIKDQASSDPPTSRCGRVVPDRLDLCFGKRQQVAEMLRQVTDIRRPALGVAGLTRLEWLEVVQ